jgi:diguanylate cyclase (GGDEF)-like protein
MVEEDTNISGSSRTRAISPAGSHLVSTCITFAALAMFIGVGAKLAAGQVVSRELYVAFTLNIALILIGWRRTRDLEDALGARAEAENNAHKIAYCDHTTGLANRREISRVLDVSLLKPGITGALLLLDLDHFKKVNDLSGHAAGDAVLKHVAANLQRIAPPGSCCARLGGDEFAVLLLDATEQAVDEITEAILMCAEQQVLFTGFTVNTSASIGISSIGPGSTAEEVLRRADIAMYAAKRAGRNRAVWFSGQMEVQLQERLLLEAEIRDGIEKGEFVPFYQPQIDLPTGALTGFEVLARWHSPSRGLVEPSNFIEAAEASGLIAPLSLHVMRQALMEARTWPTHLQAAVNISPVQFRDPMLAERILKLVTETNFPPQRLELEITESSIFEDQEQALTTVRSLKNAGICISLDDFGTGYASLTQLQALPFDRIKIDRSFIANFLVDTQSHAIVTAIAALGESLRLPITAEGVETDEARGELELLGCASAQGWLFGRAMPLEELRAYLGTHGNTDAVKVDIGPRPLLRERRNQLRRPTKRMPAA